MVDDRSSAEDAGEDLGEPIEELRGYTEAPAVGLLGRILGSLRRRALASQLVTLGWSAMGQVVLEFLAMIHSLFEAREADRGEKDDARSG